MSLSNGCTCPAIGQPTYCHATGCPVRTGGYIPAPPGATDTIKAMSVGQCANGHTLWLFEGDKTPQHIVTAEEARSGAGAAKLNCPNVIAYTDQGAQDGPEHHALSDAARWLARAWRRHA